MARRGRGPLRGRPGARPALERVAAHADSRGCLVLLGEMLAMPGFVERLSETLMPKERT